MEKKYGVYLCKGCGIGESIDFESLAKVIKKEGKIQPAPFPTDKA